METAAAERETVSEKPKRGRPRRYPAGLAAASQTEPGLGERSYVNRLLAGRALSLLGDDVPEGAGLVVLAELGRVEDGEMLVELARVIGEKRMPAGEAVDLIRRCRLGKEAPAPDHLVDRIIAAIDAHRRRYPASTTPDDVLAALAEVADLARLIRDADEASG